MTAEYTTIGLLEFSSIAAGFEALDAAVKKATARILDAGTVCPGKYYLLLTGEVAEVEASLAAGKEDRGHFLVDELFIPNLHPGIVPAIQVGDKGTAAGRIGVDGDKSVTAARGSGEDDWEALGVFESFSVAGSIYAADCAAKETEVEIMMIRLGREIGGKSFFTMTGSVHEVETAMDAAVRYGRGTGLYCNHTIIPRAHPEIKAFIG